MIIDTDDKLPDYFTLTLIWVEEGGIYSSPVAFPVLIQKR